MTEQQIELLSQLFSENEFCIGFLATSELSGFLDRKIEEFYPFPDSLWDQLEYLTSVGQIRLPQPVRALRIIESESPLLLNRDLASIALLRAGDFTMARADRVCGLLVYDDEEFVLALEAALSLCHWRNWKQPLSKWMNWNRYVEIIERGLAYEKYRPWCSYAFIWASLAQGASLSADDPTYNSLLDCVGPYLQAGKESLDEDLQVACNLVLNKAGEARSSRSAADFLQEKSTDLST